MKRAAGRRLTGPLVAIDAGVEAVAALILILWRGAVADAYGIDESTVLVIAAVFAVAAAAVAAIGSAGSPDGVVRLLAGANIAGGIVGWALLVGRWGTVEADGRWLLAAGADLFIALGLLELLALRMDRRFAGDGS